MIQELLVFKRNQKRLNSAKVCACICLMILFLIEKADNTSGAMKSLNLALTLH